MAEVDEQRPVGSEARRATILGVHRGKLAATISKITIPAGGKKTLRFRADTKKKLDEKKAAGTWTGIRGQELVLRLGGAAAITATSQSESAQAVRTTRWLCRASRQSRT